MRWRPRHRGPRPLVALGIALALLTLGCAAKSAERRAWQSQVGRDHPLAGRIWDVERSRFADAAAVFDDLASARFVLLGEKHDNPDHHAFQARVVRELVARGRRPAVAFEMLGTDQGDVVARQVASAPDDAAGIGRAVEWAKSGWPDWSMYEPIFRAALQARLPIIAANLATATAKDLGRHGVDRLDPALVRRLGLDEPLAPEIHAAMAEEIKDSHCGYASDAMVKAMIPVQRARDGQMAESLVAAGSRGAVLVAGLGHVRKDRGIPPALLRRDPAATIRTVVFLEVADGHDEPQAYAEDFGDGRMPTDYAWFTPRVDSEDPCKKFEKDLERMKKK